MMIGCIPVSSPQYHVDMYCGRSECKTFPLARYWFFSWGTWRNFRDNLLFVPFGIPFAFPFGISVDILTDVALFPLDLPLAFFLGENNEYTLSSSNEAIQLSFPQRNPAIAYSSCFGGDSRLFLVYVQRGALEVSGMVSIGGTEKQNGNWRFTPTGLMMSSGKSIQFLSNDYDYGSYFLIVASRDFNSLPNPLPFMHYHGGYQLYTSSLGIVPTLEFLYETLGKDIQLLQNKTSYSCIHLKAFLDYSNGLNTKRTFLSISNKDASSDGFLFQKSTDFQGTIFDLGTVSDMLNQLEASSFRKQ